MGNDIQLTIIRRGSSLSRIDLNCSKEFKIKVLNTLSVNSRFVVEYIIEHLHLSNNNEIISIIGSGAIGGRIGDRLNKLRYKINIYSPSLTNPDEFQRKKIANSKGIGAPEINISMTAEQTLENATHVIIAIDAEKVTKKTEQLSKRFFQLIPNGSRIVSVSEFRVFEEGAIEIIIDRIKKGEITARLDSHSFDLSTIKDHLAGLETFSAAMKGPGCGQAMDQAALIVLSDIILQKSFKSPLGFKINPLEVPEEVTIIGAGILGLITGFFLCENGYQVNIIDEHICPYENKNEISDNCNPTLDGFDARHASITETMPHAVFYRKDSLIKYPLDHGGWRIIDTQFNNEEIKWIDKFNELSGYRELIVYLINQFISNINRLGIQLWEQIFEKYPQIVQNTIKNHRIIRICSSLTLLNVVSSFQSKYHQNDNDNILKLSHSQVLQRIPSLVLKDGDAGGIEVPGFTINHQQFCINLIKYLETKTNVTFKWSNQIQSINNIHSSKIIFASSLNNLNFLSNLSLAIQGVLGCSIQIPNKDSIKFGFKITEKEPIGVINVTPSYDEQYLYITGAFAFTGQRGIVRSKYLKQLVELFHSTIRSYLPEEIESYESEILTTKFCIRPMTPDGMPIIHKLNYDSNKKQDIYFIGGTNAGGFVQAPVLATLILDLIKGSTNDTDLCHIYRSLRLDRNTLIFN
jgi:glycine/D-amino acid oxidase-like deaminating enzyme